jgi:hypothetical protein
VLKFTHLHFTSELSEVKIVRARIRAILLIFLFFKIEDSLDFSKNDPKPKMTIPFET